MAAQGSDNSNVIVVVALDFGTAYSGYAFQFRHEFKSSDPTVIHAPQCWNDGKTKVSSLKTPTCLLLDNNKDIISFGFEAESMFVEMCYDGQRDECYFFKRFKMSLHDPKTLSASTMIKGENRRELPAIEVFSKSIKCLMSKLKNELHKASQKKGGVTVKDDEIFYVLTVPAIWNENAKRFMRQAAIQAGIDTKQLTISLEPECASLYSQYLPVDRFCGGGEAYCRLTATGTTYMIVDLGGGTADITVHEKLDGGRLREVHQACGGPWGGTMVDAYFIRMLTSIVTALAMSEFMFVNTGDFQDMMRDFETVKRRVDTTNTSTLTIKIPANLNEVTKKHINKTFAQAVADSEHAYGLNVIKDKLRMNPEITRQLFQEVADRLLPSIEQCIDDVNKMPGTKPISLILLVGGFSESPFMQEVIRERFAATGSIKLLVPEEAGLSVMKGAVIFGRQPSAIASRVIRYTYGAEVTPPFDPVLHDECMRTSDGKRCSHVFKPFMERGTEVKKDHELSTIYHTTTPNQKSINLRIYATENDDVKYTTDSRCHFVGTMTMNLNTPRQELQDLSVTYVFGNTEIKVIGKELKTNYVCEATIRMND